VVESFVQPWHGTAFRHIPAGSRFGVLDTRFAGLAKDNRWNDPGDPTLYAASDVGVAVAEFGRHMAEERDRAGAPGGGRRVQERAVYRLDVRLAALLDLRTPRVRSALGLRGGARRFLDVAVARATANYVRRTTSAQALLVPSVAFLDDPARWNLVLFLEKLSADLSQIVTATYDGIFRVGP
jgi:RES domain-containing protein